MSLDQGNGVLNSCRTEPSCFTPPRSRSGLRVKTYEHRIRRRLEKIKEMGGNDADQREYMLDEPERDSDALTIEKSIHNGKAENRRLR